MITAYDMLAGTPVLTPRPPPTSARLSWRQSSEAECLLSLRADDRLEGYVCLER